MSFEISGQAIDVAQCAAYDAGAIRVSSGEMRAAIAAALPLIVGEPVAFLEPQTLNSMDAQDRNDLIRDYPGVYDKWFPVYAIKQGASRE